MLIKLLMRWFEAPAKPWHFWMPQSGFIGGVIATVLTLLIPASCSHAAEKESKPEIHKVDRSMQLIETMGTQFADDQNAKERCRQGGFPLMWRLTRADGTRTTQVWCLRTAAVLPVDAIVLRTGA